MFSIGRRTLSEDESKAIRGLGCIVIVMLIIIGFSIIIIDTFGKVLGFVILLGGAVAICLCVELCYYLNNRFRRRTRRHSQFRGPRRRFPPPPFIPHDLGHQHHMASRSTTVSPVDTMPPTTAVYFIDLPPAYEDHGPPSYEEAMARKPT